ncbi:hypothetical protein PA598K_04385 [Paenibacillus sp. 598K]|uniref:glycosyltransferase family protein n=1 Tax=Paenibacillus sp. 598K TaxID=1117987 RepID=UPI000FFACA1E|nr:glycosyltransferase [Paenibacillus sp. 598K]GBF75949.1 hypothetical protein PA598K_04385 [Paenibacillus sp. 598K]
MRKLKLLVIARDDTHYTVPAAYYFIQELAKVTDLAVSHQEGDVNTIIDTLSFIPDFVYFHDFYEIESLDLHGLDAIKIPFAVCLHDLHFNTQRRTQMMKDAGVRHVFTYYRDRFIEWYPDFVHNMIWSPHHANTGVYRDYGLAKNVDVLLTGELYEPVYPLRSRMLEAFSGRPGFKHLPHPGYRQYGAHETDLHVGVNYAKALNQAKICVTCHSNFRYPLMKYFEIPACNSLLVAPQLPELLDLGFVPGEHFAAIDGSNFVEVVDYYLTHEEERAKIASNGMRMVHERHSTKKRVEEFVESIKRILAAEARDSPT